MGTLCCNVVSLLLLASTAAIAQSNARVLVSKMVDHELESQKHDGDVHFRLKLDSQFAGLLNDGTRAHQGGNLVVEPICDHVVTQPDAVAACEDFHPTIPRFKSGTRVVIVGSYVHDKEHGWMEIHPVVRMTEIQ